jgi:hypothetical protein
LRDFALPSRIPPHTIVASFSQPLKRSTAKPQTKVRAIVSAALFAVLLSQQGVAENPVSSDSIADSVGINVHLHYTNTPYANFALVKSLLTELRVRHIRDGLIDTTWAEYYKRHNNLGQLGIHCLFVTSPKQSDTLLATYPARMAQSFEGYEGPNEYNQSGDAHWSDTLKAFMPRVYEIVKKNPSTGGKGIVVGPSLTQPDAFPQAAGMQAFFDYSNMHNYFAGRNPGTSGWGGGGYGSIDWNLRNAKQAWDDKPVMTTETGYTTDPNNKQSIPEDVEGKYMPRLILEQLLHHIQRTYIYELIDVGPKVSQNDAAFGLVRNDGSKKPAYIALKNLMDITADSGSAAASDLSFNLSGDTADVHHLLARRSDGTYLLFYWIEKPAFDQQTRQPVSVPNKVITFDCSRRFSSAELLTFQASGEVTSRKLNVSGRISLPASDTVSVARLRP